MEHKYNLKSPAVKRLMREARELCQPTELYYAQPLEDNLFEWHFTVRGPPDTEFDGGRYHGRIILPPEYPMKPPSIMLLTPNGRFELGKKICLSMSAHHPETWQPSWSIRTVLMAIIGFMPSKGAGAIGALDYTPKERSALAKKSMDWKCSVCGSCNSTSLLEKGTECSKTKETEQEIAEIAGQIAFKDEEKVKKEKEKMKETQQSSLPSTSSPTPLDTTDGSYPSYPSMPFNNPWMQSYQQQYMAAYNNPYYMYMFSYPNAYGPQMPAMNNNTSMDSSTVNQSQPTNQSSGLVSNAQDSTNQNNSGVRQRTAASQNNEQTVPAQVVAAVPQHNANAGMISLIIMWFIVVSALAFILRRIFVA